MLVYVQVTGASSVSGKEMGLEDWHVLAMRNRQLLKQ